MRRVKIRFRTAGVKTFVADKVQLEWSRRGEDGTESDAVADHDAERFRAADGQILAPPRAGPACRLVMPP